MNPERWERVKQLYDEAQARPPAARAAFLAQACAGDKALYRDVQTLLDQPIGTADLLAVVHPRAAGASLIGRRLGVYDVQALLGRGGMGDVYRARDTRLERDVAIKVLPTAFVADPDRLARFEREARIVAALNHPHIAAIYGLEESEGLRGLVLELVEGDTLAEQLARASTPASRGLPLGDALEYARQIARALEAAHAKGITHRDLKPANIKLARDGAIKLLDFGIAKMITGDSPTRDLTRTSIATDATLDGAIVGTPGYMSPQQARGETVDKRADIWAFGCVVYEMLSGRGPFARATINETLAAVCDEEPDWDALSRSTPAKIRQVLRSCLQKDPTRRPQDIAPIRISIDDTLAQRARQPIRRWAIGALSATMLVAAAAGILLWQQTSRRTTTADRSEWVQLTNLPDSVSQPALSPDGRMLAFVRGVSTFQTEGQVYVKLLHDGEPKQLTRDDFRKMSPVFSPDGSQIAYTTIGGEFDWDTWLVPVLGGEPSRWLPNASGLVWIDRQRLLFSEIKSGRHMAIVAAGHTRAEARAVYVPSHERGMAHRSYPSPDGTTALVVEMDGVGTWTRCRLVPLNGGSAGRQVGPPGSCTFGAWSPDGRWIYLSSNAGGAYHVWRQRVPDGDPEQLTSGPTEEEGIAVAPDGRSIVTAVGLTQRPIVLRSGQSERQISLEGYAFNPRFTPDGKRLLYQILKTPGALEAASDLWIADVDSGRRELLFPDIPSAGVSASGPGGSYDVSRDGRRVVLTSSDTQGRPRPWVIPIDRSSPPSQIPSVEGHQPMFGPPGEILFSADKERNQFVYRAREDGTGIRRAIDPPSELLGISPDARLLVASVMGVGAVAYPLTEGNPVRIWGRDVRVRWSSDSRSVFLSFSTSAQTLYGSGRTYVIPLAPGRLLPEIPAGGFKAEAEIARLPGVRVIEAADVAPGPTADVYAFSRITTQRNLYRIPVQ